MLYYSISGSAEGRVLLARTDRGVRALFLGENDADLEGSLNEAFPGIELRREESHPGPWMQPVIDYLDGGTEMPDLPLDPAGTPFQQKVWDALRAIPAGETRTYGQLAESIGLPGGARAVAGACAGNRIAVLVPCHRAVRGDGGLGGFRWGIDRKRRLLESERHEKQTSLF